MSTEILYFRDATKWTIKWSTLSGEN